MSMDNTQNNKEQMALKVIENYVKNGWKIFIDTCSVMYFASRPFWEHIIPLLKQYGAKIIVPLRVVQELQKHEADRTDPDRRRLAHDGLKVIAQLIEAGFVDVRGEEGDHFADNVFQVVFTKFRLTHKLLLITQDKGLARDIESLNDSRSVKANEVHVRKINQYGYLSKFRWDVENSADGASSSASKKAPSKKAPSIDSDEMFSVCTVVTPLTDAPMTVGYIPKEHDTVYTSRGPVVLQEQVAAGGEGIIYTTNTPYVAKIYKRENNTRRKFEKIKRILSKKLKCDGICFPVEALYNADNEFVGFLMPKAKGKELQRSIFIKPLFEKYFPGWKKRDTVQLCVTILKMIRYLHKRNVIMGDINPANILVVSPTEVYFVDTDSYQIEDLPCPVGTINYTAPEIQGKKFSEFLRTVGNEHFAVATLLFMIMLPGKPPYSQQGGENPVKNIINMDFSYPLGESSNKKTPDGPWRFIWSHLTYDIKNAFYETFRKDGSHADEKMRLSVEEWLSKFEYFLELLDSGKYGEQDKMSEELFPTRYKKNPKEIYTVCKLCGTEVAESQSSNGICRECLKQGETYRCSRCGKEILFTNYQKYIKQAKRHELCADCFDYMNAVGERIRCADCGKTITLTNREVEFHQSRGHDLPKRCKVCRDARKNGGRTVTAPRSHSTPPKRSSGGSSSSSGGTLCFITTAVCEYFGKSDDCVELNTLRHFRDTWLRVQPDGPALIAEYYRRAPLIVSRLKASDDYGRYCTLLWNDYLKPCLERIENGDFEGCKRLYTAMFRMMDSVFGDA